MEEKFGITNLKLLIAFPIELGNIADAIGKENSSNWKKWFKLVEILDEAIDLLKVDWSALKDEYNDLSENEKIEIKEFLVKKFDIANDKLEEAIEKSFSILFSIESLVKETIALFKNLK